MPTYFLSDAERTPFHEIKELCIRLDRATGDRSEEERLKAALRDAVKRLHTWMKHHREEPRRALAS